jgi:cytoskeletal protein RodZ
VPSVAEQLRAAREERKLTLHQVAELTKLKSDHVRALEAGDYDAFAAPVYIKGFVRTYATLLKLEVPKVMTTLEGELSQTTNFAEPPSLVPQNNTLVDFLTLQLSRVNWRIAAPIAVAAILLLILIVVYRSWRSNRVEDFPTTAGPGLYQPAQPNQSGETLPLPGPPAPRR